MTKFAQMLKSQRDGLTIVERDDRNLRSSEITGDRDDDLAAGEGAVQESIVEGNLAEENNSPNARGRQEIAVRHPRRARRGFTEEEIVATLTGDFLDAFDHTDPKGMNEADRDNPYELAPGGPDGPGERIAAVSQFGCGAQNTTAGRRADPDRGWRPVEDAGGGGFADPRSPGDIGDCRHRPILPLLSYGEKPVAGNRLQC